MPKLLLPDRPISPHPNLVTEAGLKALEFHLHQAREACQTAQTIEDVNERRRQAAYPLRDVARLPAIAASVRRLAGSFVLDGEAVVIGPDGLSQFDALRRRDAADKAVLFAFDLLQRDGRDLRGYPLEARQQMLSRLLRRGDRS